MAILYGVLQDEELLCTETGVALIFVEYEIAEAWLASKGLSVGENNISIEPVDVSVLIEEKTYN